MAHLSLSCLGPFQVTLDGQPVTRFKSNKVRALLAYLAVEADRPHRRERLAGLLWPEWPDREALSNLRYALSDLRRVIRDRVAEPPYLLIDRNSLQFNTGSDCWVDVAAFVELSAGPGLADLEKAVALYRGPFLEGFSVGDGTVFEEWALLTRQHLGRQMSSCLGKLARAYEQLGLYEQAQHSARQQLELEPWEEAAHRQLMRALALSGQRSAALAQFELCRRLLADELGVEPVADTLRLYDEIRDERLGPSTAAPAPAHNFEATLPTSLEEAGLEEGEEPVFVAREHQLAQLSRYLEAALQGQGRVVFVTGEAGSGKTALIQAFARQAQASYPELVAAWGQGNAHTGVGDPYLPFRQILGLLSGDVEAQLAAGSMTRVQARRLWRGVPLVAEALAKLGPELVGPFLTGPSLLDRVRAVRPRDSIPTWLSQLETVVARTGAATGRGVEQSALFEQFTQVLRALAHQYPLLLAIDDLQWADSGSLHLLFHLGRRLPGSRILLVGAYRPAEIALGRPVHRQTNEYAGLVGEMRERHPLDSTVHELQRTFGQIQIDLEQAEGRRFIDAFLDSQPNSLGAGFREALHKHTQGHPLFTVELLRGMQQRGDLAQDREGRWVAATTLDWETLPPRVEAVIAERVSRLPPAVRHLLSIAAVEGEIFTAEVAAEVAATDKQATVRYLSESLDREHRLVRAYGIQRMGDQVVSQYRFRHILFQRYLYSALDRIERVHLHEWVGTILERLHSGHDGDPLATVSPQLARHFEEAGLVHKAVHYLCQAGERAVQLSAYHEAIAHLTRGLDLLMNLPDSQERARQELALQVGLGMAWTGMKGCHAHETETAHLRARELSRQIDDTGQHSRVIGQLSLVHFVRARYREAYLLAEEALCLSRQAEDPLLTMLGDWRLGVLQFSLGDYATALTHLEQVISRYRPREHHRPLVALHGSDAGPSALAYAACCLWCLGYPDQAARRSREALALARQMDHPLTLVDTLCYGGCLFNEMRRDGQALRDSAEELHRLVREKLPGWLGSGTRARGQALARTGALEAGIATMREGLALGRPGAERCFQSGCLLAIADAEGRLGRLEEGLGTLDEAQSLMEETDERYCEAELHRLRGVLLVAQGDESEAESSFHRAVEVARRHRARSWDLRATTSLARLWQSEGRSEEAHQALAETYGWFTEGFGTRDLKEAKTLLEALS